jgi:hypothetical protein
MQAEQEPDRVWMIKRLVSYFRAAIRDVMPCPDLLRQVSDRPMAQARDSRPVRTATAQRTRPGAHQCTGERLDHRSQQVRAGLLEVKAPPGFGQGPRWSGLPSRLTSFDAFASSSKGQHDGRLSRR